MTPTGTAQRFVSGLKTMPPSVHSLAIRPIRIRGRKLGSHYRETALAREGNLSATAFAERRAQVTDRHRNRTRAWRNLCNDTESAQCVVFLGEVQKRLDSRCIRLVLS